MVIMQVGIEYMGVLVFVDLQIILCYVFVFEIGFFQYVLVGCVFWQIGGFNLVEVYLCECIMYYCFNCFMYIVLMCEILVDLIVKSVCLCRFVMDIVECDCFK